MGPCRVQAIGLMKPGPLLDLWEDYQKRLKYPVTLIQHPVKQGQEAESLIILKTLKGNETLIALDERGKSLSTQNFYTFMQHIYLNNKVPCFALGGADGHHQVLRDQAQRTLSLGALTWPHMLARVMLIEQLYRIQQLHQGHPYHRS